MNNGGLASYNAVDAWPLAKTNYYRIKAIESSGHVLYSKIVKIESGSSKTGLSLYPNPAPIGSQLMLQMNGLVPGSYTICVYNSGAQLLQKETVVFGASALTQALSLQHLQKGMYVLEIKGAVNMQQRFLIQ
jgi:hypothetical protein